VWIYGNDIGVDPTGLVAEPNGQGGIWVGAGPTNVRIGTNADGVNDAAERNIISGNGGDGIFLQSSFTIVAGRYIGLAPDGLASLGNVGNGIRIQTSLDNTIGGIAAGMGNTIAFNGGAGVDVADSPSIGNAIRGNSIHDNAGLGIDLGGDGVTPNG